MVGRAATRSKRECSSERPDLQVLHRRRSRALARETTVAAWRARRHLRREVASFIPNVIGLHASEAVRPPGWSGRSAPPLPTASMPATAHGRAMRARCGPRARRGEARRRRGEEGGAGAPNERPTQRRGERTDGTVREGRFSGPPRESSTKDEPRTSLPPVTTDRRSAIVSMREPERTSRGAGPATSTK